MSRKIVLYKPETMMTPGEVARAFQVDPKTVTRWAKQGKLKHIFTLGGHRRYFKKQVDQLLKVQAEAAE